MVINLFILLYSNNNSQKKCRNWEKRNIHHASIIFGKLLIMGEKLFIHFLSTHNEQQTILIDKFWVNSLLKVFCWNYRISISTEYLKLTVQNTKKYGILDQNFFSFWNQLIIFFVVVNFQLIYCIIKFMKWSFMMNELFCVAYH